MHNGVGPTKVISIDTGPGRPRFTALQWPRQADPVVRGLASGQDLQKLVVVSE